MNNIGKLNVLCIEDDLVVADYISSLLDKNRYRVKKISDGKKALDFLLTTTEHLDIIILDYYLPSLNGMEILKELKIHKKNFPVIFLTVDETLETAVRAMKEGAIDYLPKSSYLKAELNIKVEKAYQLHQERLKKDFYEEQLSTLSLAIEQSPNSVMITNKLGNIEYANNKFTQNTGYTFEEVKGKNPRIFKTNSYEPKFFEKFWNTIAAGKIWKGEFINRKKSGELFYEKATITPIKNKLGEIVSYLGIKEDITELKRMGEALNKKNVEMDQFFTVVVDLLCIIDNSTGKFVRLNKAWENTLGYPIEELTGKSYIDFVHPDDIESTLQSSKILIEIGRVTNFVNRYQCKNGEYKFIEWSAINNEDGTSYGSARDITERKLNEIAIQESEERFRSIFEMSNAGIFFSDKNGQIILANQALQAMVEYSTKELYQMDFSQFTHLDDLANENEMLRELISRKINQYRIEKRYVSKTNKIIWVDLSVAVIRHNNSEPLYYVGVVNDISARKQYEQQLKNINTTKDKFFSIISHDLRNQFSGIRGISEILMIKKNILDEANKDKYVAILHQSSKSALNLLENLLEWSRLQLNRMDHSPKQLNLFDIVEEVYDVVENQSTLKQIKIENKVDKNQLIFADRNMINTVIRNILNNAIKFTPVNGHVVVSAWSENKSDFISIRDNGVGMPPETIAKLFKIEIAHSSFGTEREKGSGLGLILCREFINKHGGEISIESETGKGSVFIISLPSNP